MITNRICNTLACLKTFVVCASFLWLAIHCGAQTAWDIKGPWTIGYGVEEGYGQATFTITNQDFSTGLFTGDMGGWPYSGISGSIAGSTIHFTYSWWDGTPSYGWGTFDGIISTNGTMSGNMIQNYGNWSGSWQSISGQAVLLSGPHFTIQPLTQVVGFGQPVIFTASCSGYPSPSYQWQFNGTNIPGATNTYYNIPQTSFANIGLYDVVALNSIGTNTSAFASLSFLNERCFPGLVLYGPVGTVYDIKEAVFGNGLTNWITITNITLGTNQPFVFVDYSSLTNNGAIFIAVPHFL